MSKKPMLGVASMNNGRIVITQKVSYRSVAGFRHKTVSMTLEEAEMVRDQMDRHIALMKALVEKDLV